MTCPDIDAALLASERLIPLDQDCARYIEGLNCRVSMTHIIRCLLEVMRRSSGDRGIRRGRIDNLERWNRAGRFRLGDFIVLTTNALFGTYGRQAYALSTLLAGQSDGADP